MREVDHPNIVRLHSVYFDRRHIALVMDLARGGDLFDLISNGGALPERRAARLLRSMFSAVRYLHDHGICHRDLKLENWRVRESRSLLCAL